MAALTLAMARLPWRVTRRASLRKALARSSTTGVMASMARARRHSMLMSTPASSTTVMSWLTVSTTRMATLANSWVSEVMRLTMRPERNSSKNERSWAMVARKASRRRA
jgi:hypothetical protein